MGLTVGGTAEINGYNISHDNGSLTFLSTPSLSNSGSLSVSNGELVLQKGGTFDNSSVNLTTSVFKPTGTVSVTNGGSLNLNNTSSVVLQGDTTLSQSGTASWPELDLGGKKLTLGSTVSSFTIEKAFTIANGESLSSGSGNVTLQGALTLNGEIKQGGGILAVFKG